VRHTPSGGNVGVILAREGEEWTITVSDTGPGIPPNQRSMIFERFTQGDAARVRDRGGAGLGLPLCRVILELHGGTIVYEEGSPGARFRIRLPSRDSDAVPDGRLADGRPVAARA